MKTIGDKLELYSGESIERSSLGYSIDLVRRRLIAKENQSNNS
jgi:hypothetical protein